MIEKLLEVLLAAKSGALSGVLLVAGTIVTVTAGNGITTVTVEHPYIDPISIELPAVDPEDEEPDEDADEEEDKAAPVALKPQPACDVTDETRTLARERVASAFNQQHAALEELREKSRHEKAHKALEQAGEMLEEIADKADRALTEMCGDVQTVADRAVAAMETVISLARTAATVTPSPKPTEKPKATPKQTEKPKTTAKATPKPSRTPSCDDRLYENKMKMYAVFEKYHSMHDKMYFAYKRTSSDLAKLVLANDELMHRTLDESKHAILSSGCAGDLGASVAARAAATFERAYQSSAQAVASQGR